MIVLGRVFSNSACTHMHTHMHIYTHLHTHTAEPSGKAKGLGKGEVLGSPGVPSQHWPLSSGLWHLSITPDNQIFTRKRECTPQGTSEGEQREAR